MTADFRELIVPTATAHDHTRRGGRNLRMFVARVDGGFLRVMLAEEPMKFDPPRNFERHLSLSFAESNLANTPPGRMPTREEIDATIRWFDPLGFKDFERFNSPGTVVHFYGPIR